MRRSLPGRGLRRAKLSEAARDGAVAWAVSASADIAGREIEIGTGYQPDQTGAREKRIVKIDGEFFVEWVFSL